MLKQAFVFKTTTHFHLCPPKHPTTPRSAAVTVRTLWKVSVVCLLHSFCLFQHVKREMETFKQTKYFPALHIVLQRQYKETKQKQLNEKQKDVRKRQETKA